MKTPKRHHELTTMEHSCTEKVWDFSQEQVNAQRWKRKNRVKQLKRTIERLTYENRIFKETFKQNRAFLKELLAICKRPNSSTQHRLTDVYQQLSMQLMSLKNYDRKEQSHD